MRSFLTGTVINTTLDLVFIPLIGLVMLAINRCWPWWCWPRCP